MIYFYLLLVVNASCLLITEEQVATSSKHDRKSVKSKGLKRRKDQFLNSSKYIKNRENFLTLVIDRFTRFLMFYTRFNYFLKRSGITKTASTIKTNGQNFMIYFYFEALYH